MRRTRHYRLRCLPPAAARFVVAMIAGAVLVGCQPTGKTVSPAQHEATLAQGVALLQSGRYADAYAMFNSTSPFATKNADTLNGFAIAADMTAKKSHARRAYEALAVTAGNQAYFYNNRGYSRMLNGELQAAYGDLTRAASLAPDNVKIRNNLRMLRAVLPRRGE